MRCPLFRATCGRQQGWEAGHGSLPSERPGAGDEGTRSDSAGPEQADYVLGSGTYRAHQSAPLAAAVPALPAIGVWRAVRPPKRVPWAVVEQVLSLYREKYFDFSVRHFHEKLREEHGITYSYTCIKRLLQGAGLVVRARKRGPHRRKRERRP